MTTSIIAKNVSQGIFGSVNGTGQHTVTSADPALAYTVPTGKRARVRVTTIVEVLTAAQNLRYRVAGILILQLGINHAVVGASSPLFFDLGEFVIDEGQTVTCTTSNVGTEGGVIRLNASVLQEIART